MDGRLVRLHHYLDHTCALGPGNRAAVWLQGCKRRCPGCMTPESRDPNGGNLVRVEDIFARIASLDDIEGVTISGGEPFLQVDALYTLLRLIRENTDLGVIIYTGYTFEELREMHDPKADAILDGLCDLLIDGGYVDALNDGVSLRGSSNQRVICLTDRYADCIGQYQQTVRRVEIRQTPTGSQIIGIPERNMLESWESVFGQRSDTEQ